MRAIIVMIFSLWNEEIRPRLARCKDIDSNDIKVERRRRSDRRQPRSSDPVSWGLPTRPTNIAWYLALK